MEEIGKLCEIRGDIKFEWRIKDFLLLSDQTGTRYESPQFYFSGSSWKIRICPNGNTENESNGWISLYIMRKSGGISITVEFSFSLKTDDGKSDLYVRDSTDVFDKEDSGWGFPKFIRRSELIERKSQLLPSDALTVICTLKNKGEKDGAGNGCNECSKFFQKKKILDDLKELFLKQEDCDVIIRVQEKEFPVHRAILQARSPVLAATFRNDMKEKSTGTVDIEDCDPDTFSDLLCFLYYGETKNLLAENVFSLFSVADKYDVPDLRAICVKFMKAKLSIDTFCQTISLALLHRESELIKLCTDFFVKNLQEIIVTVEWQSFVAQYPTESNELFIKALVPNKKLKIM